MAACVVAAAAAQAASLSSSASSASLSCSARMIVSSSSSHVQRRGRTLPTTTTTNATTTTTSSPYSSSQSSSIYSSQSLSSSLRDGSKYQHHRNRQNVGGRQMKESTNCGWFRHLSTMTKTTNTTNTTTKASAAVVSSTNSTMLMNNNTVRARSSPVLPTLLSPSSSSSSSFLHCYWNVTQRSFVTRAVGASTAMSSSSSSSSSNNNNTTSTSIMSPTASAIAAAGAVLALTSLDDETVPLSATAGTTTTINTNTPITTTTLCDGVSSTLVNGPPGVVTNYDTADESTSTSTTSTTTDDNGVDPKQKAETDVRRWEEERKKNPLLVSEGSLQGARWTMEDAYVVANGGHFVAVFDGHGGSQVSSQLRDRLHPLYAKALPLRHMEDQERRRTTQTARRKSKRKKKNDDDDGPTNPSIRSHTGAMKSALRRIERDVLRNDDLEFQGSTCVAVLVHTADDGSRTLLSANVGDSRAILSRGGKAIDLTRDHKPNDEKERARIRSMGEDVQWDPWGQIYRIRDLSLSRAIGDRFAKPVVTSEPEMRQEAIRDDEDEFFLLASDGLYDVMTSQEVVDFVRECLKNDPEFEELYGKLKYAPEERKENMAKIVANEALERGSADNVCVIVVWLKDLDL